MKYQQEEHKQETLEEIVMNWWQNKQTIQQQVLCKIYLPNSSYLSLNKNEILFIYNKEHKQETLEIAGDKVVKYLEKYKGQKIYNEIALAIEFGYHLKLEETEQYNFPNKVTFTEELTADRILEKYVNLLTQQHIKDLKTLVGKRVLDLQQRVEYIASLHKQYLNGRETEDELFELGILAGIEETEKIMFSEEDTISFAQFLVSQETLENTSSISKETAKYYLEEFKNYKSGK